MPLEVQGPRELSPLEVKAVEFVFHGPAPAGVKPTEIVSEIQLKIVNNIPRITKPWLSKVPSIHTYNDDDESGLITISKSAFPYTDALDIESTRRNTDEFKPGNMHYLSTLIFECAYHWQKKYNLYRDPGYPGDPSYHFSQDQLKNLRLFSEQHASAAQVYFLIAWQLRYKLSPGLGVPYVDLTSQSSDSENIVGPVNHYTWFFYEFLQKGKQILDMVDARSLLKDFNAYSFNLLDRGERTPCKESTQIARNLEGRFYDPIVEETGSRSRPCREKDGLV